MPKWPPLEAAPIVAKGLREQFPSLASRELAFPFNSPSLLPYDYPR